MKERVFNYLKENGKITTWDAFERLGCTRLSEYIRQLRIDHTINDKYISKINQYGEKISYKIYFLGE